MIPPQAFPLHELPKELEAHRISTTSPHTVNLGVGECSKTPELLVAAAWSIAGANWFYTSEVDFRVTVDRGHSTYPVRVPVGPEADVDNLLQQLRSQMGLGEQGDSSETSGSGNDPARKFSIVYGTGKGKR